MKNNGKNIKKGNVRKKKKIRKKNKYKGIDLYIFCSVLVLVAIGIIMVFSASYYDALYKHKNVFYFLLFCKAVVERCKYVLVQPKDA